MNEEHEKTEEEPVPRRQGITETELDKYGYTPGCPGCIAKQKGMTAKKGHNEVCRKRIEALMKEDAEPSRMAHASRPNPTPTARSPRERPEK